MSKKIDSSLLQEDLYKIFEVSIDADEKQIKKSFRKKALECHPDKNPDNPDAAKEFDRLSKILGILLDPGVRSAYNKVLKARKEAAIRSREADAKTQKLKSDLAEREKAAQKQFERNHLSEEEKLKREIKRLEEEGEQLIAEELEKLQKEAKAFSKQDEVSQSHAHADNRVKVKWKESESSVGYTKDELEKLFYKWGEINAVVVKTKGSKGTALIEFKTKNGADLAYQFEKGLIGKPLEVTLCSKPENKESSKKKDTLKTSRDLETVAEMNKRREDERRRLIEEMLKNEKL